ncbi:MAG: hypothetical protein WCD08_02160 [Steroidobacteraceae bacterium]
MTMRNFKLAGFVTVAAALLLAACANQMEPAQNAIAGIESAVSSASTEAGKYVPDQLSAVQAKLAELKAAFDKKDYKTVLSGAPALLSEAQALVGVAAMKKEEVMKTMSGEWTSMAASLPQLVSAVKSRVDMLSKSHHAPAGVDLAAAKTGLADATTLWGKAQAAFSSGNLEEAVNAAKEVKAKAEAAAAALKMKLPGAAPAAG